MCIIYATDGVEIPYKHLNQGWKVNSDGGGYAFIDDKGVLRVRKGLMTFRSFMDSFERDWDDYGDKHPFVVHFRIGTHGLNDAANTHPHLVTRRLALAHNGVLRNVKLKDTDPRSDTRAFIDNTLRLLPKGWIDNPAIRELIGESIGMLNKLAIVSDDSHDGLYLINEDAGYWDGGVWYSNSSYIKPKWKKGGTKTWVGRNAPTQPSDPEPTWEIVSKDGSRSPIDHRCHFCGGEVVGEPWCWECMACVVCGNVAEYCTCEAWKEYIAWDYWGDDYLDSLIENEVYGFGGLGRGYERGVMELSEEEWLGA